MHPRTREVLEHLESNHAQLLRAVDVIPSSLREREPGEGRWSVAGVLEHLAVVDEAIAGRLTSTLTAAREAGLSHEADEGSILSRLDVDAILDRGRPRTASAKSQPRQGVSASDALAHYQHAHQQVCDLVRQYDGLALGDVTAPHPVLGEIDVYQWLLFLGAHEGRHADQVREIGEALGVADSRGAGTTSR